MFVAGASARMLARVREQGMYNLWHPAVHHAIVCQWPAMTGMSAPSAHYGRPWFDMPSDGIRCWRVKV